MRHSALIVTEKHGMLSDYCQIVFQWARKTEKVMVSVQGSIVRHRLGAMMVKIVPDTTKTGHFVPALDFSVLVFRTAGRAHLMKIRTEGEGPKRARCSIFVVFVDLWCNISD